MSLTPVILLGSRCPHRLKEIQKISAKWEKRTKSLDPAWPKDGTFDVSVCEDMELRIRDYKPKDKTKKREKKKELELEIINMFKDEGQRYRKHIAEVLTRLKNNKQQTKEEKIQQMNEAEIAGLYPSLTGSVYINGNFDINKGAGRDPVILDNTEHDSANPLPSSRISEQSGGNATNKTKSPPQPSPKTPIHTGKPAQEWEPKHCSTTRKWQTRGATPVIDCYAGKRKSMRNGAGSTSYWVNLDHTGIDLGREINRSVILELEESIDACHEEVCDVNEQIGKPQQGEEIAQTEQDSTGKQNLAATNYDLRYRPNIHPPDRYTDPGQFPILIKGTQTHYIPWQTTDLAGLISKLPEVHEGAGKWIRAFEEETVGKLLALGDIKAVWAQTMGAPTMEDLLKHSGKSWMLNPMADGIEFNAYRPALWQALRAQYPSRIDPKALKGEPLQDTENPAAYISRQLKRWKQETEEEIEKSPVLLTLFRNAIVEALPTPVRSRLDEVVGLTSMPYRQFNDHIVHAVEKYRKDEAKLREQDETLQRKLAQMQLTDLQSKGKAKTQAAVMTEDAHQEPRSTPPVYTAQPADTQRSTSQQESPQQPSVVVNVYPQQEQTN